MGFPCKSGRGADADDQLVLDNQGTTHIKVVLNYRLRVHWRMLPDSKKPRIASVYGIRFKRRMAMGYTQSLQVLNSANVKTLKFEQRLSLKVETGGLTTIRFPGKGSANK